LFEFCLKKQKNNYWSCKNKKRCYARNASKSK